MFNPIYENYKENLNPVKIPKLRRKKGRPKKVETEKLLSKMSSEKFNPFIEKKKLVEE